VGTPAGRTGDQLPIIDGKALPCHDGVPIVQSIKLDGCQERSFVIALALFAPRRRRVRMGSLVQRDDFGDVRGIRGDGPDTDECVAAVSGRRG
jgi:hypothetical protein